MKTCSKCKKPTESFPITKKGKPSPMCQYCYDWMKKWNADKEARVKAVRQNPPEGQQICVRCKKLKPLEEFQPNPTQKRKITAGRELSTSCRACRAWNAGIVKERYRSQESGNRERYLTTRKEYMRGWRDKIIAVYGGHCICCGETEPKFLELDHVNEDGHSHRKQIGNNSEALYRWAEKNGFPPALQILCANCHNAKSFWGACPHQEFSVLHLVQKTA